MGDFYMPELGQIAYGCPPGDYAVPNYADALVRELLNQIGRVFWNVHQQQWDEYDDPEIPGLTYHHYWWGDEEAPEAAQPNFAFDGVEIRWYKYPGRGMSCNKQLTAAEWCAWFQKCLGVIMKQDYEEEWGE